MFVFIASVHHTGTQFTEKLFLDAGFNATDKHELGQLLPMKHYHRAHIADSVATELKDWLERGFPLVVPLRHPMEVARSWLRRGKPVKQMVRQFELLSTLVHDYGPLYLPIDHEHREKYLAAIREKCGTQIVTDWPIVSSKRKGSEHKAQLKTVAPSFEDYRYLEPLQDNALLREFYPGKWLL